MKNYRSALLAAMLALAGVGPTSTPALANPVQDDGNRLVAKARIGDLDLATGAGQAILRQRVRRAARQVCAAATDGGTMVDPDFRICYTQAFDAAWRQAETKIAMSSAKALAAAGRP